MKLSPRKYSPWFCLVIGVVLLPFTSLVPSLWLAAWLAPLFLLRFARTHRARIGIPLIALAQAIALGINSLHSSSARRCHSFAH